MQLKHCTYALCVIFTAVLVSCGSDDEDNRTLTRGEILQNSIIDLPSSVTGSDQSGMSGNVMGPSYSTTENDEGLMGLYGAVRHYAALAEDMATLVTDIMTEVADTPEFFVESNWNIKHSIDDPSDPDAPKYIKIEKPVGEAYEYKISLYFTEAETPGAIIRFTITGEAAKGRIVWGVTEAESVTYESTPYNFNREFKLDVAFDGTVNPKTLEVKVVQGLDDLIAQAKAACTAKSNSKAETESILSDQYFDVGQPSKVHLYASSDGSVVTLYSTSFHPAWLVMDTFYTGGEGALDFPLFDNNRAIYTFRGKAFEENSAQKGARLDVALPLTSDTSVDWVNAAFNELLMDWVSASAWDITLKTAYINFFNMMDNSAFFTDDTLLGFYDGTTFNMHANGTLAASADLSSIQHLLGLDLSGITVPSPKGVFEMDITVE